MAFDWRGYVDLAEFISNNIDFFTDQNREACYRAAISRAYYGVYGQAWRLAQDEGASLKGTGVDHSIVRNYFLNNTDREKRRLGFWLATLQTSRKESDYNGNCEITNGDSLAIIKKAKKAISFLDNMS